ncbi:MAG TPA: TIGR03118 family protein [Chitinophagaceae bacterium]|nr:TIGR03118 family protein [Chitinophagaceae bacterium]
MRNLCTTATMRCMTVLTSLFVIVGLNSCDKKDSPTPTPASLQNFTMVNVVASDASFTGARVDPHLLNGWGIAFSATGTAWISSPGDHSSVVYNGGTGAQVLAPVSIPTHGAATGGAPSGQIFNGSTGFKLPNGNAARFIFAGLDGVISGWNGGAAAIGKVDRNGTSVYTGLAIAVAADTFLYAADFKSGKIDVFDKTYTLQASTFTDPSLPAGYSPFNIQNIGGKLYVTYAQPDPATGTEKKGVGLGVVNVFNADGSFVKRLATGGTLNAPWGVAQAPAGWLTGAPNSTVILVGNFGDGHINAYDATTNGWLGTLQSNGTIITIDGLWAISFAPSTATAINADWLFFSAGPGGGTKGLFGYVTK